MVINEAKRNPITLMNTFFFFLVAFLRLYSRVLKSITQDLFCAWTRDQLQALHDINCLAMLNAGEWARRSNCCLDKESYSINQVQTLAILH